MLSDAVLKRLAELNREALPAVEPLSDAVDSAAEAHEFVVPIPLGGSAFAPATFQSAAARPFEFPPIEHGRTSSMPAEAPAFLDSADLPAIEHVEIENDSGKHVVLSRRISDYLPDHLFDRIDLAASSAKAPARQTVEPQSAGRRGSHGEREMARLGRAFPDSVLFLDLETCGLGSSMIFLIGLVRAGDDGQIVEQILARNYQEERSILEALWQRVAGVEALVTFNGKSFDWPLVQDRTTYHRFDVRAAMDNNNLAAVPTPAGRPGLWGRSLFHCDLLHHARRKWRHVLPNCKLQTLERMLCGRGRKDDIPGHLIPQAYHSYVRSGQTDELDRILHHNALDLVTLVELTIRMLERSATE
jgi:uncharacterized protein YprB with RNaseH-like and TPR domain